MSNLPDKLIESEKELFDKLLFNYMAESLNGMSRDEFLIKYDWYMVDFRNKLITLNKQLS